MLEGYKTYISAGAGVIIATVYGLGYIDEKTALAFLAICGFSGFAAVRKKLSKIAESLF